MMMFSRALTAAYPAPVSHNSVLMVKNDTTVVATSSTRRKAQLLALNPGLKVPDIRGNVVTRLNKLADRAELDATVLALAGLTRLNFRVTPEGRLEGDGVSRLVEGGDLLERGGCNFSHVKGQALPASATAMMTLPVVAAPAVFQPPTQVFWPVFTTTLVLGHFLAASSACFSPSILPSSMAMTNSCVFRALRLFHNSITCAMARGRADV